MHPIDKDLTFIRSTVPELEDYLLSNVLYWPVSARGGVPLRGDTTQLTIGNLLLSLKRLESITPENSGDTSEIAILLQKVDEVHRRWKSNWDKKIGEEIRSRLRLWDQYLSEVSQAGDTWHGDFPYNIRHRVILGLLFSELNHPAPKDAAYLEAMDHRLMNVTHRVGFIWDEGLQTVFPENSFWYLYRQPA